jgi:uncharacterized protein (TIGR00255 family)
MIRSMTGFSRQEQQFAWGQLAWELKTVNHRYLEMSFRLPEDFRAAESGFRQIIGKSVRRGKIECGLHFRPMIAASALEVDTELLESLMRTVKQTAERAGERARIDVVDVLRWPGIVRDMNRDAAPMHAAANELLERALTDLSQFRDSEGGRLREALELRASQMFDLSKKVEERLPEIRTRIRTKLQERIAALVKDVDQNRIEQELVIIAQRLDVDEEIDRLRGHLVEVRKTFEGAEPAGRRLDFLMQELNREVNTLSSKSQDIETTRAAVDMKVLIEQMREQVQNIE